MKINVDRSTAGYAAEKNEKSGKSSRTSKPVSETPRADTLLFDTKDELELTSRKAAVLDAARESADTVPAEETGADALDAIRQKLASVNSYILKNPAEALLSQAHLNSETVAELVG